MKRRLLLIGSGAMGSLHARVIQESGVAQLAGLVEKNEKVGRAAAERFDTTAYTDIPDLGKYDGVIIAAPTEFHFEIAKIVLESGTPLLIEKPISDSWQRTEEILASAAETGTPLMCGLLERFNPAVMTALAMVDEPHYFSAVRHSPYAPRIRTGVAWDLLIHDVDLACRLFESEATRTTGLTTTFHPQSVLGADDVAEAVLSFGPDQIAHVSASRTSQRKIRTITIQDSDKLIEADLLRRDVTVYRHVSDQAADSDGRGYRQQTVIEIPELVSNTEPLRAQLDRFLGLINGSVDLDEERRSIAPAHKAVDALKNLLD